AFIGWGGVQPLFTEFSRDGETIFDARFLAKGVETYRAYRMPWRATPATRPHAVAVATGESTTVHVRGRPRRVVVDSLDSSGAVLGTTAAAAARRLRRATG
ncbi:MAG TPA: hypothetical protein VFY91_04195, partial [Microbacterium sp.]|nr:hypothetical protein [Microbacterium sp.]